MGLGAANVGSNANSVGGLSTQSLTQETSNYKSSFYRKYFNNRKW